LSILKNDGLEIKEGFGQTETVVFAATFPWMYVTSGSLVKPSVGWCVDIVSMMKIISVIRDEEGRLIIRIGKHRSSGFVSVY
jgi:acetyl-CoA synthetase